MVHISLENLQDTTLRAQDRNYAEVKRKTTAELMSRRRPGCIVVAQLAIDQELERLAIELDQVAQAGLGLKHVEWPVLLADHLDQGRLDVPSYRRKISENGALRDEVALELLDFDFEVKISEGAMTKPLPFPREFEITGYSVGLVAQWL